MKGQEQIVDIIRLVAKINTHIIMPYYFVKIYQKYVSAYLTGSITRTIDMISFFVNDIVILFMCNNTNWELEIIHFIIIIKIYKSHLFFFIVFYQCYFVSLSARNPNSNKSFKCIKCSNVKPPQIINVCFTCEIQLKFVLHLHT